MSMVSFQNRFIEILRDIDHEEEKTRFLRWIHKCWDTSHLPDRDLAFTEILKSISTELRTKVPFNAVLPSERIHLPTTGPNGDCKMDTTLHIDEFLYSDSHIDELVELGHVPKYYCADCLGRDIKPLTFISHSMSINRIQYIFKYLLPTIRYEVILDVGARLGGVMFGAYLYTSSPRIIGVEMNVEFCRLQQSVVDKYVFGDRIQIICNNILKQLELLDSANVIVLNNVFEFFCDAETEAHSWHLLAENINPGTLLVTVPHLDKIFEHVKVNFFLDEWVEPLKPRKKEHLNFSKEELKNHRDNVKLYRVKRKMYAVRPQKTDITQITQKTQENHTPQTPTEED